MSKKRTGLLIAVGAALGAAAAGLSYYLKYKSFNDEIDKDFHDYEEDEISEVTNDEPISCADSNRTYISLDPNKCKSCETVAEESVPDTCPETTDDGTEASEESVKECPGAATVEEDTEGAN
ncbi:MAG: hypothetical protein IKU20_04925 [Lachnospiraceae bacterium]|nr:hypothetical protein [Lachnospiraceae bacterium]